MVGELVAVVAEEVSTHTGVPCLTTRAYIRLVGSDADLPTAPGNIEVAGAN
ncbi:hypothetical protein [Streptomyces sp. NPDC092307]|uniref:hypothetical protein n=1 Tax=Streptomyces sp. NPDC092307 TaxID=3366013 RepID=UPI003825361A